MMIRTIDGVKVQQRHDLMVITTDQSVTLRCTCGWWRRFAPKDEADRATRIKAIRNEHSREI